MSTINTQPGYLDLPEGLYSKVPVSHFPQPALFAANLDLAGMFGVESDWFESATALSALSGRQPLYDGGPIAMAYSGHQFGQYAPLLGDGRAMLAGALHDQGGHEHELHLKGSGLTPFSRGGDGKATLGAAIREYIVSEAMAALGVATSCSLAIVTTGEQIMRQQGRLPGAVLARTARSHLRVGTFQYTAANHDADTLRTLADFAITRLDPELMDLGDQRYAAFLNRVAERQVKLIAQWMSFGFIHGVMNTDNMTLSGETIDYGPCAFMDVFHPARVFSSIDHYGRYAWNKQPEIGLWNLSRLAEAMLPLFASEEADQIAAAEAALKEYPAQFKTAWVAAMSDKLGLSEATNHEAFIEQTLSLLFEGKADFTRTFTTLTRYAGGGDETALIGEFEDGDAAKAWLQDWDTLTGGPAGIDPARLAAMRAANPVRIARNHQVEAAIIASEQHGDDRPFQSLLSALKEPFSENTSYSRYEAAPEPEEVVQQTFCGT
ncbi:MAG: YdiU family protein [Pseudomonadota bacterium]